MAHSMCVGALLKQLQLAFPAAAALELFFACCCCGVCWRACCLAGKRETYSDAESTKELCARWGADDWWIQWGGSVLLFAVSGQKTQQNMPISFFIVQYTLLHCHTPNNSRHTTTQYLTTSLNGLPNSSVAVAVGGCVTCPRAYLGQSSQHGSHSRWGLGTATGNNCRCKHVCDQLSGYRSHQSGAVQRHSAVCCVCVCVSRPAIHPVLCWVKTLCASAAVCQSDTPCCCCCRGGWWGLRQHLHGLH